ncbi:DUF935 domain-containing protein [Thauera butanivorans]|uniref:DUF935 domain-containing protein n=1 Tax=Thauera butanivorans TaxID=86174 RepID=UPI003AB6CD6E
MTTLLDASGNPIGKPRPVVDEAAHIELSMLSMFGGLMQPDDDTLATRGGNKGVRIYRELERDAHAWAVLDKRKRAVIARTWKVVPASERPRDVEMAERVEAQLLRFPFDQVCHDLLDATLMGYAVGEIMWRVRPGEVDVAEVIPRAQERFVFDMERRLRLLTRDEPTFGRIMPERKFIVHRRGGADGNPYGLGLGTRLFWPVFFKRQGVTFWLTFLDKFGAPAPVGKYPSGASDEQKRTLLQALKALRMESATIIPEGMLIDLVEAKRAGNTDAFEKLARYMDEQMALIVLGETMSTTSAASGLGSRQAEVHNEVRLELARVDADLLTDTLSQTLVRWIVEFNDPGAGVPRVERDFSEPEDLGAKATRDKQLVEMGLEPEDAYIAEFYPGWKRGVGATLGRVSAFAAPADDSQDGQRAVDAAIDAIPAEVLASLTEGAMRPVVDRLLATGDVDEAHQALLEAWPELDTDALEQMLARALFVVETWARIEAQEGL